ncbi:putative ribonuclease H-like domain-containing protein, partial [Tanacetum coccineum]
VSANDKFGLGYGDHRYDGILSYENEVLQSVFMNKESELVNQPLYDRFVTAGGMHAVPPPMTGNYMSSGPDVEIDYSQFTYDCSAETHEPLPKPTVNEPNVVCQPKVWSDAPIIEEYESDSEDEHVSLPTEEQETPSFANQQVKTPRETVKNQFTHSKNPKVNKKGLGYGFTTKACFVCGSLSHLIRDCDFHEKRMAKQAELNNRIRRNSIVLPRTGKIPVNTARASGTKNVFHNTTALRTNFSKQKVNTTEVDAVSAVGGKRETADYPHRALQNKGIVDSGCSRHMTGNNAYLAEYQDFNGGPVAFGGSKGYITSKEGPTAKDAGEALLKHPDLKTDEKPVDKEDQVFLDELERLKRQEQDANDAVEALRKEFAQETEDLLLQAGAAKASSTNIVNTASIPVSTASPYGGLSFTDITNPNQDDLEIPALEEIYDNPTDDIFTNSSYDDEGAEADFTNLEPVVNVSPIPTLRINSIHPSTLILGDPQSAFQTRSKHCLFACFLSQNEPKKISEALEDESLVDVMQEELLQFKIQKLWILVDLPYGKKAIGTKRVYRNKKDERGVVVRNKARLVAQGHRQEKGIDYDEVFALVARIEAIRIFLAFTSYMGFIVYQMDVKSAFLYGKIDEGGICVPSTSRI